jgi:hypothetical protein
MILAVALALAAGVGLAVFWFLMGLPLLLGYPAESLLIWGWVAVPLAPIPAFYSFLRTIAGTDQYLRARLLRDASKAH